MGLVREAVQDCSCNDRIGEDTHPIAHGTVARNDDGAAAVALVYDLVEPFAGLLIDLPERKVVQDEEVDPAELVEQFFDSTAVVGLGQFGEELVELVEGNREALATGGMAKGLCKVRFPGAGWTGQQYVINVNYNSLLTTIIFPFWWSAFLIAPIGSWGG